MKKLFTVLILIIFASQIFASETDSLKTNKWSIVISPNFGQAYHENYIYGRAIKNKTNLIPGGSIGLQKNITNSDGFKYNIGLNIANYNTKQVIYYPDDNIMTMGYSVTTLNDYNVKTENIKCFYFNLLITPVNINIGMLKNHLFFNYSLNVNINIYYTTSNIYKDNNNNVVYNYYNEDNLLGLFNNRPQAYSILFKMFDLMQNDIGLVFYPKYLKKYNIGISPNFGFYFNPQIFLSNTNLVNGFYKYKIFHLDFIWHLK